MGNMYNILFFLLDFYHYSFVFVADAKYERKGTSLHAQAPCTMPWTPILNHPPIPKYHERSSILFDKACPIFFGNNNVFFSNLLCFGTALTTMFYKYDEYDDLIKK